jgi:hypothetical protein
MDGREDLVLMGDVGTGKTHMASALCAECCERKAEARFFTASSLVMRLRRARDDGRLDRELARIGRARLLVVDELGFLPLDADGARLLFQVVSQAYEAQIPAQLQRRFQPAVLYPRPYAPTPRISPSRSLHENCLWTNSRIDNYRQEKVPLGPDSQWNFVSRTVYERGAKRSVCAGAVTTRKRYHGKLEPPPGKGRAI